MSIVSGTEEGWAAASHDSRRSAKQKDIAAAVSSMQAAEDKRKADWEQKLGEEFEEATLPVVLKGGVNCVGSTAAYRRNFDKVFANQLKEDAP